MQLAGRVALVTGGGSGIGRATAVELARRGAAVAIADLDMDGAEQTVARCVEAGAADAFALRCDVSVPAELAALIDAVVARAGGLDVLHSNAGIPTGDPAFPDTSVERILQVLAVDLAAVILGAKLALPHLRAGDGGVIVNTASQGGVVPLPTDQAYGAAKAGVIHFTRSCRRWPRLYGVRVNAVVPGWVDTPIVARSGAASSGASDRWGSPLQPVDVARVVLELVEDDGASAECREIAAGK